MKELVRTNNTVYLSFAQAVLKGEGIETILFDAHMSVMDGSIGALPRRLMVVRDEQFERARRILADAEPKDGDPTPT
jgi:Putative prokaryotic signal transducing protein